MREFFIEIKNLIYTKEDLIFYLEEIELAGELILKEIKKPIGEKLKDKITNQLVDVLVKIEEKEKIKDLNQLAFFLKLLTNYLLSLPQVKIEVAFSPERKTIIRISQWLEESLDKKIILDINVNPKIIGGAIIEYKGKRINFSLAKKISQDKILNKFVL